MIQDFDRFELRPPMYRAIPISKLFTGSMLDDLAKTLLQYAQRVNKDNHFDECLWAMNVSSVLFFFRYKGQDKEELEVKFDDYLVLSEMYDVMPWSETYENFVARYRTDTTKGDRYYG